jgi:hypothetical protein
MSFVIFFQVFASFNLPPASLLNVLVLAAPIVSFGGRPGRVAVTVVAQIDDHDRRRMAPALPEDCTFALRLMIAAFCGRPPEPATAASHVLVF